MSELTRPLVFEPCVPGALGSRELSQDIAIERNGIRVTVRSDEFRDWWPSSRPIWVSTPNFDYNPTCLDNELASCVVSLEVGLANPHYVDEVLVLIETLLSRKVAFPGGTPCGFEVNSWVIQTLRPASMVLGCERLLRHILSHYWGSDYFEEPLWEINSKYLYELIFSSINWERRVTTRSPNEIVDFGYSQSELVEFHEEVLDPDSILGKVLPEDVLSVVRKSGRCFVEVPDPWYRTNEELGGCGREFRNVWYRRPNPVDDWEGTKWEPQRGLSREEEFRELDRVLSDADVYDEVFDGLSGMTDRAICDVDIIEYPILFRRDYIPRMWRHALELELKNVIRFLALKIEWNDSLEMVLVKNPTTDYEKELELLLEHKEGYGLALCTDKTYTRDGRVQVILRMHISLTIGTLRRVLASRRESLFVSLSLEKILNETSVHTETERVQALLVPRWVRAS